MTKSVSVHALPHGTTTPSPAASWRPKAVRWPAAASGTADIETPGRQGASAKAKTDAKVADAVPWTRAGTLPVLVKPRTPSKTSKSAASAAAAPARVTVQVRDHGAATKAGVNGLLFTASVPAGSDGGPVSVAVDYSGFKDAYGGDWSSRLHLVQLPPCALTTPSEPECQKQTPVEDSTNDATGSRITGTVRIASAPASSGMILLGATSGNSSGGGDFSATPLSPSGSWSAGGNSGDFTYSYPISVPPTPGDLTPNVELSYSSQSVDGRLPSTDNQPSWIGEGWDYSPGAVTRSYVPCKDDPAGTAPKTSDNCWAGEILHIVFNGRSQDIVYDASTPTNYSLSADPTAKVELKTMGTTTQNDTYDGDYWKITDGGKTYYYGRNSIPSYGTTHSAWTVPVYGAHDGDPCHKSTFATSSCQQAWQWNLDEVIDAHGNAMVYYYNQHTNYYGANGATTGVKYTREGWLDHIDYGLGNGSTTAPQRVQFTVGDRCVAGTCDPIGSNTANWPDVPWDLNCNSGASCAIHSPAFFATFRLKSIATQIYDSTTKKYKDVDEYSLAQSFPNPNDGNQKPALWLDSITHTADAGTLPLPPVKFSYIRLANRFNVRDGYADLFKMRIAGITTESGESISINYKAPTGCSTATNPSTNTTACFPMYWTPDGLATPFLDWFNKYVVSSVTQNDNTKASPESTVTSYDYSVGKAAWHYDDNEVVKAKYRTYGQWRGYSAVRTLVGEATEGQTVSETRYYQGMNGDTLPGGTTRSANVSLSADVSVPGEATSVADADELAGNVRETVTYRGVGGPAATAVVDDYWVSAAKATRSRTGLPALEAKMVRNAAITNSTAVTSAPQTSWRTDRVSYAYDKSTGLLRYTDDQGDIAKSAQETCATTSYAPVNADLNLVGLVSEVETVQGSCGTGESTTSDGHGAPTGVNRPADVVSDTRTYYDTPAPTSWPPALPASQATPTLGEPTLVAQAQNWAGGAFDYQVKSAAFYDSYGRVSRGWDALGNLTKTDYVTTNGQTTGFTVTNPLDQETITTLDPSRGLATKVVDPNSAITETAYDALGRTTAVWLPGRSKATQTADYTYTYAPSQTSPPAVTTKELTEGGSYTTSVEIYDGMLRSRQTQSQTPQGGRLLTDTFYDSRGLVWKANNAYWDGSSTPGTTLVGTTDPQVTDQILTTYDSLARPVLTESQDRGTVKERIRTVYGGDRVTTIPLTGGTATSTVTDARGRTTETDAYQSTPTVTGDQIIGGSPAATKFTFDAAGSHGQNSAITDPGSNQRSYAYNLLGEKVSQTDPDTGTSTMGYDADGHLTSTTDARGKTISVTYDALGRKSAQYDGPDSASPKLADWTYDNPAVPHSLGRMTASTRYDSAGNAYIQAVNGYNIQGNPTKITTTVPSNVTGLAGSYSYLYAYTPNLGLPLSTTYPAVGNLPSEKVSYGYNSMDMVDSVGGLSTYARDTTFDAFSRVVQVVDGASATNSAVFTNTYDEHTGALNNANISRSTAPENLQDTTYTRDLAGNITKITDSRLGSATDTQCFAYNGLERLTDAWTATDNCAGAPTVAGANPTVGGADPSTTYWTSWTFDVDGNRKTQVNHGTSGISADTTTTYTYGKPGAPATQPDTLTGTQTTAPDGTVTGGSYTYDATGNTTTRTTTPGTDTLVWNDEGQLASFKTTGQDKPTSYTYDADGNQLLRTDPDGRTTLFLSDQDVEYDPSVSGTGAVTATRYVALPGDVTCTRTGPGDAYSYIASNDQATGTTQLTATDHTPTFRLLDPYGNPRGTQPADWPGSKGFVGGTQDPTTGLTRLGARDYDPVLGRFTSADPLFEATDPNQIGGYTYAGDSPVTQSDPSGLSNRDSGGGSTDYSPPASECPPFCSVDGQPHGPSGPHGANRNPDGSQGGGDLGDSGTQEITDNSPTSNDSGTVGSQLYGGGKNKTGSGGGGYWHPAYKGHAVCYGRTGCTMAYNYLLHHPKDVAGAKEIAATYCIDHMSECQHDAQMWDWTIEAEAQLPLLIFDVPELPEAGESKVRACTRNSFTADTKVLEADGETVPIAAVKVGDEVLATDPVTGTTQAETVTDVIVTTTDKDFTDLTVRTGDGPHTITSTQHHPYWDATAHQWKNAADLHPGDKLRRPDGTLLTVAAVRNYHHSETTYNLTVEKLHTYYVLAGQAAVLVHNATPGQKCDLTLGAGPNAREGVGLENGDIEADGVRDLINESGNAHGCHTCNARTPGTKNGDWIPDHQPPSSLVDPGSPQTAYPHCLPCARRQGGVVSQLSQGKSNKEW
ncbi:polymorphic toxin-type HINT domain-containing protein [Actinacidiphila alni]|uniref:polymorphic toxin-type HINT domain-containing protein n=1 Tax=Actinacidiphila alni TaxID=380248 RepID=UPI0015A52228|nr:polymorphic toxin-type HINT domain-containing protein [Actinacidiphila alni]